MPTRTRGTDTPSILDLVISDGTVIENVNFLSPLGNSDHSVLLIEGSLKPDITEGPERFNYSKGAYDNLRDSLSLDWEELLLPHCNDIDKMWEAFKRELSERIHKFIPRVNNFSSWEKRFLGTSIRQVIT